MDLPEALATHRRADAPVKAKIVVLSRLVIFPAREKSGFIHGASLQADNGSRH
jgi:hypothetical protein